MMALLLHQLFSQFLKPGDWDTASPRRLLNVDYKDPEMQLSRGEVVVGHRVNKFLKEAGLTRGRNKVLPQSFGETHQVLPHASDKQMTLKTF